MSDIETRLIEIVSKNLSIPKSRITRDSRYVDDLGLDSLDQVEFIMKLEEEFGIEIPDEAAEKVKTVDDAIKYIEKHSREKAAS